MLIRLLPSPVATEQIDGCILVSYFPNYSKPSQQACSFLLSLIAFKILLKRMTNLITKVWLLK